MRKLYLFFSIIFMMFVLIGCRKDKLPIIKIENPEVTIDISEEFDIMSGVKAFDQKNNDLTNDVKVEGGFSNLYPGSYEITYTITDSKGKTNSVKRTITVIDKLRTLNAPQISNPEKIVVEYKDFKLTNETLYLKLRELVGSQTLTELIDSEIFKDNQVNEKNFNEYYNNIVKYYGETEFIKLLSKIGFYQNNDETADEFTSRVKTYLSLYFLKVEEVKKVTLNELTESEIRNAKANYKEDLCAINLVFNTKAEALNALVEINDYQGDKGDYFKSKFIPTEVESNDSYLSKQLNCDYERIIYQAQTSVSYRDKIFSLEVNDYTKEPVVNNNRYYLTYIIGKANLKETYDETLFEEALKDILVNQKMSNEYVNTKINSIRTEKGLKIYDPLLAEQFKTIDPKFKGVSTSENPNLIASYNGLELTADAFYDVMKTRFGAPEILNSLNYAALSEIGEIALTEADLNQINTQIYSIKSQYEYYYGSNLKYTDFLITNFGVISEEELTNILKTNLLTSRYILGYNDFSGVQPITETDLIKQYENYFNVKASHILFTFNDEASKQLAYKKAYQVIHGVKENEEAYIKLNGQAFVGLDQTPIDQIITTFGQLATNFSEDTGSKVNQGDLGYFTPGKMVKSFEDATRELARLGVREYSTEPLESEFGFHIILITDVKTPKKPENYDTLTKAEIEEIVKNNSDPSVVNYYNVLEEIKASLEETRLAYQNIEKHFASLREDLSIIIHDQDMQNHYHKLNELSTK